MHLACDDQIDATTIVTTGGNDRIRGGCRTRSLRGSSTGGDPDHGDREEDSLLAHGYSLARAGTRRASTPVAYWQAPVTIERGRTAVLAMLPSSLTATSSPHRSRVS